MNNINILFKYIIFIYFLFIITIETEMVLPLIRGSKKTSLSFIKKNIPQETELLYRSVIGKINRFEKKK